MNTLRRIGITLTAATVFAATSLVALPALADATVTPTPVTVPYQVSVAVTTNVYDTPSTTGDPEGQLTAGQTWYVLGIDTTGKWVQVFIPSNNNLPSWVAASALNLGGVTLPLSNLVSVATPTATAAPVTPTTPSTPVAVTVPFLTSVITTTNVYATPSTTANQEGQLTAGQTWYVLGMDSTGKWAQVYIPNTGNAQSWVPISTLNLSGVILPVTG